MIELAIITGGVLALALMGGIGTAWRHFHDTPEERRIRNLRPLSNGRRPR